MRHAIIAAVVCMAVVLIGTLVFRVRIASGISPWTPYQADINQDSRVNTTDMLIVAQNFGKTVVPPIILPTPTPPTIVGNRAFGRHSGGGLPLELFNTDDGSVVRTFLVGDYPAPVGGAANGPVASCDGTYSMITTLVAGGVGFHIIKTQDGSTIVEDLSDYYKLGVEFTCPLKGLGAKFNTAGPIANRAIVAGALNGGVSQLRIFDLTTGQTLYSSDASGGVMNCAQTTISIKNLAGDALTLVRLSDGGVAGTIPETGFQATC